MGERMALRSLEEESSEGSDIRRHLYGGVAEDKVNRKFVLS